MLHILHINMFSRLLKGKFPQFLAPDVKIGAFPLKFPWLCNVNITRDIKLERFDYFPLIRALASFDMVVTHN